MSGVPSLWVVGLPAWGEDAITSLDLVGRQALASASLVVGGEAQLAAVDDLAGDAQRVVLRGDLSGLDAAVDAAATAVVVASGDPGFFGVLRALRARLDGDPHGRLRVVPAVSSVAAVFAAVGLPWDDAHVVSAHGRDPATAVAVARRSPKVAVLTSPGFGPAELAAALDDRPRRWLVGQQFGTARAHVTEGWPGPPEGPFAEPNIVGLIAADEPEGDPAGERPVLHPPPAGAGWARGDAARPGWAQPDDAFAHRDGQITKAEVRAVAVAWLSPGPGDLLWDVGCGAGSIAVECAALGAAVCAVDRDADQIERTRANADRHDVPVDARVGEAPAALAALPDPDAVFVGGGGDDAAGIAATAAVRARRTVVVALTAVERVSVVWAALVEAGCDVDGSQIAVSRLAPLPGGRAGSPPAHRLAALNPVTLIRGTQP